MNSTATTAEVVIGEDHEQTGIDREEKSSQREVELLLRMLSLTSNKVESVPLLRGNKEQVLCKTVEVPNKQVGHEKIKNKFAPNDFCI